MTERFANNASTTLNGSINNSTTTVVVSSAVGFPTSGNFRILVDSELMLVTAVSGNTFTVTRAIESTGAASHTSGVNITHIITAGGLGQYLSEHGGSPGYLPSSVPVLNLTSTSFTQINVTHATIVDTAGEISVRMANAIGTGHSNYDIAIFWRPMTTTVQVGFALSTTSSGTGSEPGVGIGLMHAGQNNLEALHVCCNGSSGIGFNVRRWTDANTWDTDIINTVAVTPSDLMWLQIHDDGTDFVYSFSNNGLDWIETWRHAKADYFSGVPDRVFFSCHNYQNVDRNMLGNILHWSE